MLAIPNKSTSAFRGKIKSIPMNLSFIFMNKVDIFPRYGWVGNKLKKIPKIYGYLLYPFKLFIWPFALPRVRKTLKKSLKKNRDWTKVSMYYNYGHKGKIYNLNNLTKFYIDDDNYILVSSDYEKELELWFGDWKQLPPKEKQVPHHLLLYKID